MSKTQVYIVPDYVRVTVNSDGSVTPYSSLKANAAMAYKVYQNPDYKWGWLSKNDLGGSDWDALFEHAGNGVKY